MSKELSLLLNAFTRDTGIKPVQTIEEKDYFHWKRLIFDQLNSDELMRISEFIKVRFSEVGYFSHLIPKLHSFEGRIALTISADQINEFLK